MTKVEQTLQKKLDDFGIASSKLEDKIDSVVQRYVDLRRELQGNEKEKDSQKVTNTALHHELLSVKQSLRE